MQVIYSVTKKLIMLLQKVKPIISMSTVTDQFLAEITYLSSYISYTQSTEIKQTELH